MRVRECESEHPVSVRINAETSLDVVGADTTVRKCGRKVPVGEEVLQVKKPGRANSEEANDVNGIGSG